MKVSKSMHDLSKQRGKHAQSFWVHSSNNVVVHDGKYKSEQSQIPFCHLLKKVWTVSPKNRI